MLRRLRRILLRKAEAEIGASNWCATKRYFGALRLEYGHAVQEQEESSARKTVEDDARELLKRLLGNSGATVTVGSANEALDLIQRLKVGFASEAGPQSRAYMHQLPTADRQRLLQNRH